MNKKLPYNRTCGRCGEYKEYKTSEEMIKASFKHINQHMEEDLKKMKQKLEGETNE